jgi:pentatricopeptide repeat protein
VPLPEETYAAAIRVCGTCNKFEHIAAIIEYVEDVQSPLPTLLLYTSALAAAAQCAEWSMAVRLLQRMCDAGIVPDSACYEAALLACTVARQVHNTHTVKHAQCSVKHCY